MRILEHGHAERAKVVVGCEFQAPQKCLRLIKGVRHQLHTVVALLFELKAQQKPFEFGRGSKAGYKGRRVEAV
jgi:hypothetical protein